MSRTRLFAVPRYPNETWAPSPRSFALSLGEQKCPACRARLSWSSRPEARADRQHVLFFGKQRPLYGCFIHRSLQDLFRRRFPDGRLLEIHDSDGLVRDYGYIQPSYGLQWDDGRSHHRIQTRCRTCWMIERPYANFDAVNLQKWLEVVRQGNHHFPPEVHPDARIVFRDCPPSPSGLYRNRDGDFADERYVQFAAECGVSAGDFVSDEVYEVWHDLPREGEGWVVNTQIGIRPTPAPMDALGTTWDAVEEFIAAVRKQPWLGPGPSSQ